MKFTVSSAELHNLLQAVSKVISSKNTLPILDYFLFDLKGEELSVTASDTETTLTGAVKVNTVEEEGVIAVPHKLILDSLRELKDQPIEIAANTSTWEIVIKWSNGKLAVPGASGHSYPESKKLGEDSASITIAADQLADGISRSIFATADDELRPVMNGIYMALEADAVTFVATDAHKLVKYTVRGVTSDKADAFILPKKPANLLRNMLAKENSEIKVEFDDKNSVFTMNNYTLTCRLVEGNYPNYNAVIPTSNTEKAIVDRQSLLASIKLAAVFSNQSTNLVKLDITENKIVLIAQDMDYSTSAEQTIPCDYSGEGITIGFKSTFLIDILSNIDTQEVMMSFTDATRAALFLPVAEGQPQDDMLMLLMPMMINA